jgi:cobyrinic acid a,c-diamide synthase
LLRALSNRDITIFSAKAGPDYIDPQFHAHASGSPCVNLDPWAMRPQYLKSLANQAACGNKLLIEGMMGLFDGAIDGTGSVADLAALLDLPVLLVVDAARQSHSIAALVQGFCHHRSDVAIAGVILNRVGSHRHEKMLRHALAAINVPVFGAIYRQKMLHMPERHLGLVQAGEHRDLEHFIKTAADIIEQSIDISAVSAQFTELSPLDAPTPAKICPPGQNIAIACDEAFAFSYPHLLEGWKAQGAELSFFSPLADEAPYGQADAVYLPGGYPELHAGRLASNAIFFKGLLHQARKGTFIYGECGGYMVLGQGIVDADGNRHKMAGLLPLDSSFKNPKLHLGYRLVEAKRDWPFTPAATILSAHEFHYASVIGDEKGEALFSVCDALGKNCRNAGMIHGNVCGSFMHLIDLKGSG